MATDPHYQPITVEEFLAMDFGSDRKFELANGVIQMMTGGSSRHAHVSGNVYHTLRLKLGNGNCRPFNSDMGIRVDATTVRYPDISVVCREDWTFVDVQSFDDPVALFEVLSPSTTTFDQGSKLHEYQQIASVQAIVFIDPINRLTRVHHRQSAMQWRDYGFAQPHAVELSMLDVTLTEAEIFG